MKHKLKRKMIWLDEWNMREQEAWFSDMALDGWKLTKLGRVFATFEESEPREIVYRCGVLDDDDQANQQKIELYRKSGWEFVGSRKYLSIFREVENEQTSEVYTSPVERARTLSILQENFKKKGLLTIVLSIFLIILNVFTSQIDPVQNYLIDGFIYSIYTIVIYIFVIIHMISGMVHIRKLIKQLTTEETDQHLINYDRIVNRKKLLKICEIIFAITLIIFTIETIKSDGNWYEGIPEENLPVLQLPDIMDEGEYEQTIADHYEYYYYVSSSILVPKQYELFQSILESNGEVGNLSISSHSYEARNEWLAQKLAQALVKKYSEFQPVYTLVSHEVFDALWVGKDHLNLAFIVRKENTVYHLQYNGTNIDDEKEKMILLKIEENL